MRMRAWTDYPISELGDKKGQPGPIREVTIVHFDGGDTAEVMFKGVTLTVKVDRLYLRSGRAAEAPLKPPSEKLKAPGAVVDSAYIRIKNSKPNSPNSAYSRIRNLDANF